MNTKIELYLNDIKEYVNSALIYMQDENNKNIDKKEIIMYLSCVDEIIEEIKNIMINELIEKENSDYE